MRIELKKKTFRILKIVCQRLKKKVFRHIVLGNVKVLDIDRLVSTSPRRNQEQM